MAKKPRNRMAQDLTRYQLVKIRRDIANLTKRVRTLEKRKPR